MHDRTVAEVNNIDFDIDDQAYELDRIAMDAILNAVETDDKMELVALLDQMHSADIADFLEQIPSKERSDFLALWGVDIDGTVLSEMDENLRVDVIEDLSGDVMAEALKDLETDDVVDLIEDLKVPEKVRVFGSSERCRTSCCRTGAAIPRGYRRTFDAARVGNGPGSLDCC